MKAGQFTGIQAALGLSSKDLAGLLGITVRSIDLYRTGARKVHPAVARLMLILAVYPEDRREEIYEFLNSAGKKSNE